MDFMSWFPFYLVVELMVGQGMAGMVRAAPGGFNTSRGKPAIRIGTWVAAAAQAAAGTACDELARY
jgi:hypothetical protein